MSIGGGASSAPVNRPRRVLHVTDTFLPKIGGAEIAIDQLVRAMNSQGAHCALLAQKPRPVSRYPRRWQELNLPYPIRRYPNARASLWAGWWIEQYIKTMENDLGRFDVLIGHHAFPPGYACVKHAIRDGRPVIVYPRGGDIYEVSRFRSKKGAWRKLSWTLARATVVISASAAMEEIIRGIIGKSAAESRVVRIPNGVDVEEFQADASASRFANDPRYAGPFILGLGRTIHRKGFHFLIDAFEKIPPSTRADWKLIIAGDGRELNNLKRQATPLGPHKVLFTGLVTGADKRWLLQNCRLLAAPSLEESFGNVALEAMACGKPVIASQASGFAEIIRPQINGRLVDVTDPHALEQALSDYISLARHGGLDELSRGATQTAQTFSWQHIAQQYLQLIDRVCNAK